ncbi:MAG: methyltransferase, TrmH family [Actinomycetota bacterium]|nr:methyltransferase, TrmH family [Actinomycetota bacterium]
MSPAPAPANGLGFKHKRVQRVRKLVQRPTARQAERSFVIDSLKVLDAALDAGAAIESLYLPPGGADHETVQRALAAGIRASDLGPGVLERVAGTVTPQPVLAVAPYIDVALSALRDADLVVVCVDVRDPGNLGTVLRTAEAAGVGGVICCDGTVDVYNPKTVRASAGSLFHVRVVAGGEPDEVLATLGHWGLHRVATRPAGGRAYHQADLARPTAIVLGNEASGLPAELDRLVDETVTIPMAGRGESLNVGMAAAVLCFEAARQRAS